MRLRRGALAVLLTAAVAVPAVGTATVAAAAKPGTGTAAPATGKKPAAEKPATGKPSTKKPAVKKPAVKKPAKKIKFSATGTVTAVDAAAGTVTVKVTAGTKEVKGKTITVAVPTTLRVLINGAKKKLADLTPGYSITVTGLTTGTTNTADKIVARKVTAKPTPSTTPTPAPTPTTTPTPAPTEDDSVSPEPSETPEP